ncbi:MAG: malectin domain-containing carbohydrate-binding protein [Cyclobacteriaceae bacterium]
MENVTNEKNNYSEWCTQITDIAGTTEDELYSSERYGSFGYNVPVPSGIYTLRLHFAEIYFGATGGATSGVGKRVFNVTGEGKPLLTDFDIYAEVGSMTALVKEFEVSVADGTLNLSFVKVMENPKVSAIEVLSTSGVNLRIGENQNISVGDSVAISGSTILDHKIQSITPETMVPMENGCVVSVYPNPFEDLINLHFQKEEPQNYKIRIYDVAGKTHFQGTFSSKTTEKSIYPINLANKSLATGSVYLIFIESENGKFMKIFKMIKK